MLDRAGSESPSDAVLTLAQLHRTRLAAIKLLRLGFAGYGLDVSAYSDDEVGRATLEAATPGTHSRRELFGRAFERLLNSQAVTP